VGLPGTVIRRPSSLVLRERDRLAVPLTLPEKSNETLTEPDAPHPSCTKARLASVISACTWAFSASPPHPLAGRPRRRRAGRGSAGRVRALAQGTDSRGSPASARPAAAFKTIVRPRRPGVITMVDRNAASLMTMTVSRLGPGHSCGRRCDSEDMRLIVLANGTGLPCGKGSYLATMRATGIIDRLLARGLAMTSMPLFALTEISRDTSCRNRRKQQLSAHENLARARPRQIVLLQRGPRRPRQAVGQRELGYVARCA